VTGLRIDSRERCRTVAASELERRLPPAATGEIEGTVIVDEKVNVILWRLHHEIADAVEDAYVALAGLGWTDPEIVARLGIPEADAEAA
jgi:hypothetical protein